MHNMPSIYVQSWMPGEEIFIYFVTHCAASLSLAYATIRTYLAGIRNFFIEQGQGNPFLLCNGLPMLQLELVLKGIKKQHKPQQNKRLPITSTILCNLHLVLDGKLFSAYKDILMKAACSVAYFGFLRCGEFTTYGKVFNFDSNLCLGDISFTMSNKQPVAMHLFLKASKTDPFRQGCTIRYFRLSNVICPVQNLYRFLQIRLSISRDARSPLFMLPDGAPSRGVCFWTCYLLLADRLVFVRMGLQVTALELAQLRCVQGKTFLTTLFKPWAGGVAAVTRHT